MIPMSETWKPVRGHRGYQASSLGRVRSVDRKLTDGRQAGGQVLTPWLDDDGYQVVRIGRSNVRVHVAVQLAFAGPPEVAHLDGDQLNCRPGNLVWSSRVENERDKRRTERRIGRNEMSYRPGNIGTSIVTPITDAH